MKLFVKVTGTHRKVFFQLSIVFAFLILFPLSACQPIKSLGKNPSGEALMKIEALPNYQNGEFQNLEKVPSVRRKGGKLGMLKNILDKPKSAKPSRIIPSVKPDLINTFFLKPTVIWFGHSSLLIKTLTSNILIDPNFSGYAGPFPGLIKAFEGTNAFTVKDLPPIDALLISHDHYDHLDYKTIKQLRYKVKKVIVPIGVGSHFIYWGYPPEMITEMNWDESTLLPGGIRITATPAHHRSNRTFETRKTLWASYVIDADGYRLFYSGDTGYSKHFSLIGQKYGPFHLAIMECGQYSEKWPQSHMFPYQTAKASVDLKASIIIPVHWGKFAESKHPWNESVQLLLKSADSLKLPVFIPYIGQPYTIGEPIVQEKWWDFQ